MKYINLLQRLNACHDAIAWCGDRGSEQAWRECERGDWLLWIAVRLGIVDRRTVVAAACDCAELGRPYWRCEDVDVLAACLGTTRAWCRGEATIEQVRVAVDATYTAVLTAADAVALAADAVLAADAAAFAADATYTAVLAADAAYAAAHAADAATYDGDARAEVLRQSAEIVRRYIGWDVIREAADAAERSE